MLPRLEPMPLSLRPGSTSVHDPVFAAWTQIGAARAVAFRAEEAAVWQAAFHRNVVEALDSWTLHELESEAADSRLLRGARAGGPQAAAVDRLMKEHQGITDRLVALVEFSSVLAPDPLSQMVEAWDAAAVAEAEVALHHRRLQSLLARIASSRRTVAVSAVAVS